MAIKNWQPGKTGAQQVRAFRQEVEGKSHLRSAISVVVNAQADALTIS